MFIWFLIILILLSFVFTVSLYLYDNSEFKKTTDYSFFQIITNKKIRLSYKVFRILNDVHKNGKVLINVKLPKLNKMIDAIYIQPSGVYVMDIKNMNGWLYGREKDVEWALAKYKEKIHTFQNPLVENIQKTKEVQKVLALKDSNIFHPSVVFSDNVVFEKLSIQSKNIHVKNISELKPFLKTESQQLLTADEIENIYNSLKSFMTFPEAERKVVNNAMTN